MKKYLIPAALVLLGAAFAGCDKEANDNEKKPLPDPKVTAVSEIPEIPFYGTEFELKFTSSRNWMVTSAGVNGSYDYDFQYSPTAGEAGESTIKLTFPKNHTQEELEIDLEIALLDETSSTAGAFKYTFPTFKVPAPSVTDAAGNVYKAVYLKDGNYWMAENLRYVPEGEKISDGTVEGSGIWYPYSTDGTTATPLTDEASVKKLGLLYTPATAFGVDEINESNYNKLEAVQGICPEGWHIPTRGELVGLCAATTKGDGEDVAPEVNTDAVFYDAALQNATVAKANEAGFNFTFSGFVNNGKYHVQVIDNTVCDNESFFGNPKMSYYLASTGYKSKSSFQTFSMFSTFNAAIMYGKLSAGYNNLTNGVAVRCVMDKTAE